MTVEEAIEELRKLPPKKLLMISGEPSDGAVIWEAGHAVLIGPYRR